MERTAPIAALLAPFHDAWLAGRARLALLATAADVGGVSIEAYHGSVELAGDVGTAAARDAAEDVVRSLSGVVSVRNRIRVRQVHRRPSRSDADVRAAVASALAGARQLRGSRISVDAVYDGVVTLGGVARSDAARGTAFEIAIHVPGVRRVVSDVVAVSSTAGAGANADAA